MLVLADPVSGAVGSILGSGVDDAFGAAGRWVADGAVWLLDGVGSLMSSTSSVDLGAGWFTEHESVMAALAGAVVLPLLCCAAIQAVYRQSASMLARTVLVNLPLALLFSGVAVELVRLGLAATDALSTTVLSGAGVDTRDLLGPISAVLVGGGAGGGPAVPSFIVFVTGLLVAMAALVLWLELVVRSAAVAAAALFLPLALAGLAWPALSHWCRRLADTLAALVLSKLVVAAVLAMATGAVAGGLGLGAPVTGGFGSVVTGAALLALATTAPFTLLRLVPAIEAGAVVHLDSARHRLTAVARAPVAAGSMALDVARRASPEVAAASLAVEASSTRALPGSDAASGVSGAAGAPGSSGVPAGAIPMLRGTPPGPEWEAAVLAGNEWWASLRTPAAGGPRVGPASTEEPRGAT